MTDDDRDRATMADISRRLVEAVAIELEPWVVASVERFSPDLHDAALDAARRCRREVVAELEELLSRDIDDQPTTPLVVLRRAARFPTAVLDAANIPRSRRDPFDERVDPDDHYGLAIATWSDLGPQVGELGLMWGAAKAHLHLRRHRS